MHQRSPIEFDTFVDGGVSLILTRHER
jgi:hypothetical protein